MSLSSRTAVAVNVLGIIALTDKEYVTAEEIASNVGTNPVVILRLLASLRGAGLVTMQKGVGGGARLTRSIDQINLCEIYLAVEKTDLFAHPSNEPDPNCVTGEHIQGVLDNVFQDIQKTLEQALAKVTLSQVIQRVLERKEGHSYQAG